MNLPNILTLSRLALAAVLAALLAFGFRGAYLLALVVFVIAGITDWLDGYLARTRYGTTDFGRLMDPLADKVMVTAALVSFVGIKLGGGRWSLVPAWVVVAILAREFLVTGLRLLAAGQGRVISAGSWGKHKTVWQMLMIVVLLAGLALRNDFGLSGCGAAFERSMDVGLQWTSYGLSALVLFLTVVSGMKYLADHREVFHEHGGKSP